MGCGAVDTVEVNGDESMMGVLRLCDPRRIMTTEGEFVTSWYELRAAIASFLHIHLANKPNEKAPVV
jgi:hypothetical protein